MIISSKPFYFVLGLLAFGLCMQSIIFSSSPFLFALISIATISVFAICRGSAVPVFIISALGPVINMTALYYDKYIYNAEIVLLVYLGCYFFKNYGNGANKVIDGKSISYVVMLLLIIISAVIHIVFYHLNLNAEIRLIRVYLIGGFLVAFLFMYRKTPIQLFYKTALLSTLVISVAGIVEFLVRGISANNWIQEPQSVFSGSEPLAVFLCTIIPFCIMGKETLKNGIWIFFSDITALCAITLLIVTRSRTGILSLFVFLVFLTIHLIKNRYRKKIMTFIFIGSIALFSLATVGLKTVGVGSSILGRPLVSLFSSRIDAWTYGVSSFLASPLWGNGPGSNAYNLYIQLLSQFGIAGLSGFLIFTTSVFVKTDEVRHQKSLSQHDPGLFWSAIAFLIAGLGESALGNQSGYYILFLFLLSGRANSIKATVEVKNAQ